MDTVKLLCSKINRWHRGIILFLLIEFKVLPSGQLGFTCNDPALSHPFTGDTISWKLLLGVTILLPLVILLLTERKYHPDKNDRSKQQVLCWYKEYLYGLMVNLIIIQLLKLIVGSPRPHFFDTCSPRESLNCKESEYVPTYTCTKAHWLTLSDRSFPSGHTSLAVHAAFFIIYYLYKRTSCSRSRTVFAVQMLSMMMAVFCAVSRITDHRHHWWDVLAGAIIAVPILLYTIYSLCGDFECPSENVEESSQDAKTYSRNNTNLIDTKDT